MIKTESNSILKPISTDVKIDNLRYRELRDDFVFNWDIVDTVTENDGYQDNRKVKVGFFDSDDDGVVDNPELFDIFIEPTVSVATKYVFFEKYVSTDNNIERFRPYASTNFTITKNEADISLPGTYTDGQLFYFYDASENVIKKYESASNSLVTTTDYIARLGRSEIGRAHV